MKFAGRELDLTRPQIMAVLNITPDSFSDGGQLFSKQGIEWDSLYRRVESMLADGASILDIGGESTRPGAAPVSEEEELERVIPVIEKLSQRFDTVISVDTSSASVMLAATDAGAGLINDVRALAQNKACEAAVKAGLPVCLMHMQGTPETMQQQPEYDDVVGRVQAELMQHIENYVAAGGCRSKVILDPGFGFGKSFEHNVTLFKALPKLVAMGYPLLVGVSRKAMIGTIIDQPPHLRAGASAVAAALAVQYGASIVRVHDVKETLDALKVIDILGR